MNTFFRSKASVFLCVLATAVFSAFFAANAAAQDMDTAYVPFRVNVNATATAQLAGGEKFEKFVRKDYMDTLLIIVEADISPVSPGRTPSPVTMHNSRGRISLELSRQLYRGADIALYSLNGKQILHGKAAASEIVKSISHPNVAMGVYVLSVRGINGNAFTTRLAHSGGGMNVSVAFMDENFSVASLIEKEILGNWTITVSAEGYLDTSYAFSPETGIGNIPVQDITLWQIPPFSSSSIEEPSSSSEDISSSSSVPLSSSSVEEPSSSSEDISSSSSVPFSSSSVEEPSSSSEDISSSSSVPISSSSIEEPSSSSENISSSSSVLLSSSSVEEPSSSSENISSSSSVPLSSSSVEEPSSSSENISSSSSVPLCGGEEYDLEEQFCSGNTIYDKCGDMGGLGKHEYNPGSQFCHNNYTVNKCGGQVYAPPAEQCNYGVVERKCGVSWYDPQTQFCFNGNTPTLLCGSQSYNASQFCWDSEVYDKCDGLEYNAGMRGCCNTATFALSTHFCSGSTIYSKCGGNDYNPSTQFCSAQDNGVYDKCGGTVIFTPGTEACCGSSKYTISTQYCSNGTVKSYGTVNYSGQIYKTVVIGTQTWMAENLNYAVEGSKCYGEGGTYFIYDEEIGRGYEKTLSDAEVQSNCATSGRLYDWSTAMGLASSCNSNSCSDQIQSRHQGICPSGWHIPSNADWDKLLHYVDGTTSGTESPYNSYTAGKHLKAVSGWNFYVGIENLNTYGFSALPGGGGSSFGSFFNVGYYGYWWSGSEEDGLACSLVMDYNGDSALWGFGSSSWTNNGSMFDLFSVRCVQD